MPLYFKFFLKLFAITCSKSTYWCIKNCSMFATCIVIIKYIVSRVFTIFTFTIYPFNNMYSITFSVYVCINVTHFLPLYHLYMPQILIVAQNISSVILAITGL